MQVVGNNESVKGSDPRTNEDLEGNGPVAAIYSQTGGHRELRPCARAGGGTALGSESRRARGVCPGAQREESKVVRVDPRGSRKLAKVCRRHPSLVSHGSGDVGKPWVRKLVSSELLSCKSSLD